MLCDLMLCPDPARIRILQGCIDMHISRSEYCPKHYKAYVITFKNGSLYCNCGKPYIEYVTNEMHLD